MTQQDHLVGQTAFLTDAAHILAAAAPAVSAHLMRTRDALLLSAHDLPPTDVQRQRVCGACGHIFFPGRCGDDMMVVAAERGDGKGKGKGRKDENKGGNADRAHGERTGPSKVFDCGMCGRYTRVALPVPGKVVRRNKTVPAAGKRTTPAAAADKAGEDGKAAISANASSKKRAKSRKAGLQALLWQARGDAGRGSGLSLADFMSK